MILINSVLATVAMSAPGNFAFPGGGDASLIKSLNAYFGQSFVLLASPAYKWGPASFRSDSSKDDERLLRSKLGLEKSPRIGSAAPVAWPDGLYRRTQFYWYQSRLKPAELKDDFRDGTLSLKTVGEQALAEEDFRKLGLKKAVRFHRCLSGARLRVDLENVTESDFLNSVASALGGKVIEKSDEVFIDVDAAVYVRRALAYWALVKKRAENSRNLVEAADADYMILVLNEAPVSFVKKALDNPNVVYGLPAHPGTPLFAAAWKRVTLRLAEGQAGRSSTEKLFRTVVDRDQPIEALIDGQGNPISAFYNRDRSNRIEY